MALTHGYVVGELIYSRTDGPDGDRLPDVVPASDVKLTFTPAARQFVDPDNRLVVADPIPAAVMPDGQVTGDLDDQGNAAGDATAGLWLVVGKYRVTAKGHYRDFDITVTEGHTMNDPLVLGESVEYVPPTVTVQSVTVPQGAANGQVLGWQDGLTWVTGGEGGGPVAWDNVQDKPSTFPPDLTGVGPGDIGAQPAGSYATATQGSKADTAIQPGELASVAFTGSYDDLADLPTIPSTAADVGARADDWTPSVSDVPNLPASKVTSGTFDAARIPALPYATQAQGDKADTAVQPADLTDYVTTEDLPAPATAIVYYNGTNWIGPDDTTATVRPNAQRVMAFGGTTQPTFLVSGDVWVEDTGA